MKLTNTSIVSAFAVVTTTAGVYAATLSGTFDVRVVNYSFGSNQSSSVAVATKDNFETRFDAATDGVDRDTFRYVGALDFFIDNDPRDVDAESISDFFASNTLGSVFGLDSVVGGLTLSKPTFKTTTLFEFTEVYSNAFDTRVTHDDGFSIYGDGVELVSFANPTGIRTTPRTGKINFSDREFKLVYAAANGNPSRLLVEGDGVSVVPLPASAFLLLGGLGAFGLMRRKKARS
ncbi:VPLPA-CTERM sorting domain-containing protein [Roseobacter weihaiensis]|uniref:VPLPA-CTERM sorting domain-containing protein n=1 Tax=Roseobacter weihaiensis TaxID=2763262 RepID=UPI001D099F20|nr:VPLPA-CTERM sorting domain-containing protein [Roseobacter sp. H9]